MKTIIIVFLMILLFAYLWPVGDVNFDGRTNSADLQRIYSGDLNPIQRIVADINRDHRVDRRDLDILVDIILGRR